MTYEQLLADLKLELGEGHPAVPRLPFLVRDAEEFIWKTIAPYMERETIELTFPAGTAILSPVDDAGRVLDIGRAWQVSPQQGDLGKRPFTTIVAFHDKEPYMSTQLRWIGISVRTKSVVVYPTPKEEAVVKVACCLREPPLEPGDSDANKWLLGPGYGLIKYGVLALRVVDPDRWPAWKQQYDRELAAACARLSEMKKPWRPEE